MAASAMAARRAGRMARMQSVADLRRAARRALPPMVFDFIDGGAEDEESVRGNEDAFSRWWLRPRPLVDVSSRRQEVDLLSRTLPTPLVLAPAGLAGLAWPHGEALAARAATEAGIPFALSTAASCSIEQVRAAAGGPLWLQLYIWRDRDVTAQLVDRAEAAGYEAICLTVDVPLSGQRERDLRNGMTIPPRIRLRNSLGVLSRPAWIARSARSPVTFANVGDGRRGATMALGAYVNSQLNPSADWSDLRWLRRRWRGPLVIKGVLDPNSAARLVDEGADAVVVSNHGGRQLDGAVPTALALGPIVEAVDGRVPVLLDGGVRRGTDVVKALALGARACMVGRPYLWGLAAGGQEGVARSIDILRSEIDRTMALIGATDIGQVQGSSGWLVSDARKTYNDDQYCGPIVGTGG